MKSDHRPKRKVSLTQLTVIISALETKSLVLRHLRTFMPNRNTTYTPPSADINFTTTKRRERQKACDTHCYSLTETVEWTNSESVATE